MTGAAMPGEGFFRRWSRLKSGDDPGQAPDGAARQPQGVAAHAHREAPAGPAIELAPLAQQAPHPPVALAPARNEPRPPPTMEDVAVLGPDSDFSAFVTKGVDKAVQRLAMKRLFSDPHFRVRDGLDVYIDDYTRPDPVSAAMLSSLQHAKSALSRALDPEPPAGERPPGAASGGASGQARNGDPGTGPQGGNGGTNMNHRPGDDAPGSGNKPGGDVPPPPEGDT